MLSEGADLFPVQDGEVLLCILPVTGPFESKIASSLLSSRLQDYFTKVGNNTLDGRVGGILAEVAAASACLAKQAKREPEGGRLCWI
jgi:hypothetical protein